MKNLSQVFQQLDKVSWYPGHMKRAMTMMEDRIQEVQLFLEIRDARVPFSSKNYHFDTLLKDYNKDKIILFNKFDLCNQEITTNIIKKYQSVGIKCLAISAQKRVNLSEILGMIRTVQNPKYNTVGIWMMICGMPNVGKSTLINQLRQTAPELHKRKALAKQTPLPCTTKSVTGMKISDQPLAYLIDGPGVMLPNLSNVEQGIKLGLVGCIKDFIVEKERIVDFMVCAFNDQNLTRYYKVHGMKDKPNNGGEYLLYLRDKYKHYNYETTLDYILGQFRDGRLGKITLDSPSVMD